MPADWRSWVKSKKLPAWLFEAICPTAVYQSVMASLACIHRSHRATREHHGLMADSCRNVSKPNRLRVSPKAPSPQCRYYVLPDSRYNPLCKSQVRHRSTPWDMMTAKPYTCQAGSLYSVHWSNMRPGGWNTVEYSRTRTWLTSRIQIEYAPSTHDARHRLESCSYASTWRQGTALTDSCWALPKVPPGL